MQTDNSQRALSREFEYSVKLEYFPICFTILELEISDEISDLDSQSCVRILRLRIGNLEENAM